MNQTHIVFASGKYEEGLMSTYPDEICDLVRDLVERLTPALGMFNPGSLIGEELVYETHVFNVILKNPAEK